jgi:hypothetical protein
MRINSLAKSVAVVLVALMLVFMPVAVNAQVLTSAVGTSTLTYAVSESITVSGVPASLTFTACTGGVCTQSLNVTTTWQLAGTRTRVAMNLFFANPASAMSDGSGDTISAANINANKDGGSFSSCNRAPDSILTGVIPALAACNVGQSINISTGSNNFASNATNAFTLQIPSTVLAGLPANTFTGTLSYVAAAQ